MLTAYINTQIANRNEIPSIQGPIVGPQKAGQAQVSQAQLAVKADSIKVVSCLWGAVPPGGRLVGVLGAAARQRTGAGRVAAVGAANPALGHGAAWQYTIGAPPTGFVGYAPMVCGG